MMKEKKNPKNKGGRPYDYTPEKMKLVCEQIATTSLSLWDICDMWAELPHPSTVRRWIVENKEFYEHYARAKTIQADILAEECLLIANTATPEMFNVARLKIDTRKWLASKLLPKQYGDAKELEQKRDENEQLKAEIKELRESLDGKNQRDY